MGGVPVDPSELDSRTGAHTAHCFGERTQDRLRPGLYRGQDLTYRRGVLVALEVPVERIYVDHGLTGTIRARPGLRGDLAAC